MTNFFKWLAKFFSRSLLFTIFFVYVAREALMQKIMTGMEWIAAMVIASVFMGIQTRHILEQALDILKAKHTGGCNGKSTDDK